MHTHSRSLILPATLFAALAMPLFFLLSLRVSVTQSSSFLITAARAENACGAADPFCLKKAAQGGGLTPSGEAPTIPAAVGKILSAMLALLGVLFFALTVWAGFKWMTAQGNQETATSAKTTLENAVIGLVLVVVAYALTTYVVNALFWTPSVNVGGSLPPPSVTGPVTNDCELLYGGRCSTDTCKDYEFLKSQNTDCERDAPYCCVQKTFCPYPYTCWSGFCPAGYMEEEEYVCNAGEFCCSRLTPPP